MIYNLAQIGEKPEEEKEEEYLDQKEKPVGMFA
jgi:hypothetical protein